MTSENKSIMVVGQTPPPWGGQALMIKKLIDSDFDKIDLKFVPMAFSRDMDEIGRFRWRKLLHLPLLLGRIWQVRFQEHCSILYYPPGGESITGILRDIVVLLTCRPLFRRVIFHAHAGGFTEVADATPWPVRSLARIAYRKPDLFIQLTEKSPPDGALIRAKRIVSVPYGLPDDAANYISKFRKVTDYCQKVRLLFVGVVSPSKGVMVLLEACAQLKAGGIDFLLRVVGRFHSPEFKRECTEFISKQNLGENIEFLGVLTGDDKWAVFCTSDIFCFPSHFESENQPLVIIEAMQFGLPIVASDWRSIPTMVRNGENGYVVPVKEPGVLAERIALLIRRPNLRAEMGAKGRALFTQTYTDDVWRPTIESVLSEV